MQNAPTNPGLERAMYDVAKSDNARTRESVYRALLASTLLFEGQIASDDSGGRYAFKTVEHPPGNIVLPVFTDVEALVSWSHTEGEWIALRARDIFQAIAATKIAEVHVNPFRKGQGVKKPGGIVKRHEFMALAQGLLPGPAISEDVTQMKVAAAEQMQVEKPSGALPEELLAAIARYFAEIPALRGAYLFRLTHGAVQSDVVGLEFSAELAAPAMEALMHAAGILVRGRLPQGASLDFMPIPPGNLLDSVRKCAKVLLEKNPG
ncbi:MAG TPA: enhanced serine sensitivity protein SseB C-terminal domain-containing protein [Candidatus Aquilonibacter sp.]|nr:enhanced serine sensitivity protein SseB C-terminal domain-containing protein [Candidatus Aquilonibacter sp.]